MEISRGRLMCVSRSKCTPSQLINSIILSLPLNGVYWLKVEAIVDLVGIMFILMS